MTDSVLTCLAGMTDSILTCLAGMTLFSSGTASNSLGVRVSASLNCRIEAMFPHLQQVSRQVIK